MTEKLNAGAELEKELAEKLGWRIVGIMRQLKLKLSDGWSKGQIATLGERQSWAALKEYAAEAALYRTQWKEAEKLLRAEHCCDAQFDVTVMRDHFAALGLVEETTEGEDFIEKRWRNARAESAESRVAALQAQLETARQALNEGCKRYCTWYDTGQPKYDGAAMAYELVCTMRAALSQLKTS